jgi:protein-L-isoaspartate(D-aspartate) O-methyltransferase
VQAFELEPHLAAAARRNLAPYAATVTAGDAVALEIPSSDVIYVNAGVLAPPVGWLKALREGGRMILPWRPSPNYGIAIMITRSAAGFAVKPLMPAFFIPCIGAEERAAGERGPDSGAAWSVRSAHLTADRKPDDTAVDIYEQVWFSRVALGQ